jgi:hypothetical protein
LHFIVPPAVFGGNMQGLVDDWNATCRTPYRGLFLAVDTPVQLVTARQVCGSIPLDATVEDAGGLQVGARAIPGGQTERLPSWLAQVVSVRSALAGRSRRGRFFVGGLLEQDVSGNDLVASSDPLENRRDGLMPAYLSALAAAFIGAGGTSAYIAYIFSNTLADGKPAGPGGVPPAVAPVSCELAGAQVTTFLKRLPVGSMKSRRPGSGT